MYTNKLRPKTSISFYREFKDGVHRQLRQLSGPKGGSFSNIIAPCTLEQVMDMVQRLGEIQRHPFMQVRRGITRDISVFDVYVG